MAALVLEVLSLVASRQLRLVRWRERRCCSAGLELRKVHFVMIFVLLVDDVLRDGCA